MDELTRKRRLRPVQLSAPTHQSIPSESECNSKIFPIGLLITSCYDIYTQPIIKDRSPQEQAEQNG